MPGEDFGSVFKSFLLNFRSSEEEEEGDEKNPPPNEKRNYPQLLITSGPWESSRAATTKTPQGGRAFDALDFAKSGGEDPGEELRLRVAEVKHGRWRSAERT